MTVCLAASLNKNSLAALALYSVMLFRYFLVSFFLSSITGAKKYFCKEITKCSDIEKLKRDKR